MQRDRDFASILTLVGVLVTWESTAVAATLDTVRNYANRCFKKIEIEDSDIPRSMNCFDGDLMDVTQFGRSVANKTCDAHGSPGSCDLPPKCDNPAWLSDTCYGNSYLTTFAAPSNPDVKVALLCRHKWINTNEPKRFDDIAMILHNDKNGETCWFQSPDYEGVDLNGTKVPRPNRVGAGLFWIKPSDTARIQCVDCHDSGPFIISPWMNQAKSAAKLRDTKKTAYKNSTAPFDAWPTPTFISIGRHGLNDSDEKSCTHCHHVGVVEESKRKRFSAGTCDEWINHDVALRNEPDSVQLPSVAKLFMPPTSLRVPLVGKYHEDEWDPVYGNHVRKLRECCRKFANDAGYGGDGVCRRE
jgi:hypothetical protein